MQTSLHVSGKATEYPRDAVIDWHDHETGQIIHASSGVMRVSIRGRKLDHTTWPRPVDTCEDNAHNPLHYRHVVPHGLCR